MKKIAVIMLILCLCISIQGCSGGKTDAREALDSYIKCLQEGDYEEAYNMLTEFDRMNIDKETFTEWCGLVSKILVIDGYTIDKKVDQFSNYEYMGAKFDKAYGFKVTREHTVLVEGIETKGYDSEEYMIMVASENGEMRIALLITDPEELIKDYTRQLDEKS